MLVDTEIAIPIAPNSVTKKKDENVNTTKEIKRLTEWNCIKFENKSNCRIQNVFK